MRTKRAAAWAVGHPWWLLFAFAIPAIWPMASSGLTISADGALHLLRLALLDNHIRNGVPFPRWVPELTAGLGYPVFNFYGPSTYYLAEVFYMLGLSAPSALIAAFALLILLSGAGMYLLARDVLGPENEWPALLAATAYMLAPYLLTNVYIRGAIAEVGAQALLPWIFWSMRSLLKKDMPSRYLPPLALSLGALAVTHTITLLLAPPFLLAYVLVLWLETGRSWRGLGIVLVGIIWAMMVSAFFWAPVIAERTYLADVAYKIAAKHLPGNLWTSRNFLDASLEFEHTFSIPFQLGLAQFILALMGVALYRRREVERLYWLGVLLVCGLGITAWTLPIWMNSRTLLIVQFPWRMLALMSLPLALFAGAIVTRVRALRWQVCSSLLLCLLVVYANSPRVDWMPVYPVDLPVHLPAVAQFEAETSAFGTSSAAEFMPRWVQGYRYNPESDGIAGGDFAIGLQELGSYGLHAVIESAVGGSLRFMTAYFPGWLVLLDGDQRPELYPSSNLGLLTVDLPAGTHDIRVIWDGTPLQQGSQSISLMALAALVMFIWWRREKRWMALFPLVLLVLGLIAFLGDPPLTAAQVPQQTVEFEGTTLLGYHTAIIDERYVHIYPVWQVDQAPSKEVSLTWQLRDEQGAVVSQVTSHPFFNTLSTRDWPPGTVVDDAYRITLPPQLPLGTYGIWVGVQALDQAEGSPFALAGTLELESPAFDQEQPEHRVDVSFADQVWLAGYDVDAGIYKRYDGGSPLPIIRPGDPLLFTLYWRAMQSLTTNYHSFVHIVDQDGNPLVQWDHLAGTYFNTSKTWDAFLLQRDRHRLFIPDTAKSRIYWPVIGLYEFEGLERSEVQDGSGEVLGDAYRLPPIKVISPDPIPPPRTPVNARFGDMAALLGYDLSLPARGLRPGSQFSVTLHYESVALGEQDLTQFVHLYSPELGMAAQVDQPPLQGGNPTWTWIPGEVIVESVTLTLSADARPGDYELIIGFYDPVDGLRLPVWDDSGHPMPGDHFRLTHLAVTW